MKKSIEKISMVIRLNGKRIDMMNIDGTRVNSTEWDAEAVTKPKDAHWESWSDQVFYRICFEDGSFLDTIAPKGVNRALARHKQREEGIREDVRRDAVQSLLDAGIDPQTLRDAGVKL